MESLTALKVSGVSIFNDEFAVSTYFQTYLCLIDFAVSYFL